MQQTCKVKLISLAEVLTLESSDDYHYRGVSPGVTEEMHQWFGTTVTATFTADEYDKLCEDREQCFYIMDDGCKWTWHSSWIKRKNVPEIKLDEDLFVV